MKPADQSPSLTSPKVNAVRHDKGVTLRLFVAGWLVTLSLCVNGISMAAPVELGRLFYTPAQRAQLESARIRNVTQPAGTSKLDGSGNTPPPLRYDGVLIRSDGETTRWVDGKPQVGASSVAGLKPGQIRANGRIYEPYQVLRPVPPEGVDSDLKDPAP